MRYLFILIIGMGAFLFSVSQEMPYDPEIIKSNSDDLRYSIPNWARDSIEKNNVLCDGKYVFSSRLNPFLIRGNFIGNKLPEIAIWIKNNETDQFGFLILSKDSRPIIYCAGIESAGLKDLWWVGAWRVENKQPYISEPGYDTITIKKIEGHSMILSFDENELVIK